jgi:hypothetical protein
MGSESLAAVEVVVAGEVAPWSLRATPGRLRSGAAWMSWAGLLARGEDRSYLRVLVPWEHHLVETAARADSQELAEHPAVLAELRCTVATAGKAGMAPPTAGVAAAAGAEEWLTALVAMAAPEWAEVRTAPTVRTGVRPPRIIQAVAVQEVMIGLETCPAEGAATGEPWPSTEPAGRSGYVLGLP